MLETTSYNSVHPSLFEATWQEFSRFLSKYQWAFDHSSHSPRTTEIIHAILNRGKPGACTFFREEGYKYILPVLHPRHFQKAIECRHKIYYVSYGSLVLLYFDIDLHHEWQTEEDGQEAKRLLSDLLCRFFGQDVLFWSNSSRGVNGYLKVDLLGMPPERASALFARLQNALQLFLAHYENLADFEIKGKLGFMSRDGEYNWGQYGKLPIHAPGWNFHKLEEFKSKPLVSIHSLPGLCQTIENQVAPEMLAKWNGFKKSKGDELKWDGNWFLVAPAMEEVLLKKHGEGWRFRFMCQGNSEETWMDKIYYRKGQVPEAMTQDEFREAKMKAKATILPASGAVHLPEPALHRELPVKASTLPLKINIKLVDLESEPDSFVRQKEALFRYARYLKRVPTQDEGLEYLHDQNLFTGTWDENEARREARVRDILKWIANTFDASKCANGSVNVGKYDAWAAKKFPIGLIGGKRKYVTEEGEIIEVNRNIHVSTKFIAVFMAVAEFTLLINKNQDDTLPHDRAEELWKTLYAKGLIPVKFNAKKWAVCRDELERHGIIRIIDRHYHTGKAMKWELGIYFPGLGLWKGKKLASLPVSIRRKRRRTREQEHNTWLRQQPIESTVLHVWTLPRPPPGGNWL